MDSIKKALTQATGVTLAFIPVSARADPITTILGALELIQAVSSAVPAASSSDAAANASFAVVKTGDTSSAVVYTTGDSFTGIGSAGSSINIDRLVSASASATTTWDTILQDTAYYGLFTFSATLSGSSSAYSNFNGGGGTSGSGSITIQVHQSTDLPGVLTNIPIHFVPPATFSSGASCSTTFFDSCHHAQAFDAVGSIVGFQLSPGDYVEITGSLGSSSSGSVLNGSTEESTNPSVSWTLNAIPEPTSLPLLGVGAACLGFFRRKGRVFADAHGKELMVAV